METITAINLHRFGAGILVELIGSGPQGEVTVRSFEFEWIDRDRDVVRPVGGLSTDEAMMIEERLVSAGYELETDPRAEVDASATAGTERPISE